MSEYGPSEHFKLLKKTTNVLKTIGVAAAVGCLIVVAAPLFAPQSQVQTTPTENPGAIDPMVSATQDVARALGLSNAAVAAPIERSQTFIRHDVVEESVYVSPAAKGRTCASRCLAGAQRVERRTVKERYYFRASPRAATAARKAAHPLGPRRSIAR